MQDRVRALEEAIRQIGVQKRGENGYDQPLSRPSQSTRRFPSKVAQNFRANNGMPV